LARNFLISLSSGIADRSFSPAATSLRFSSASPIQDAVTVKFFLNKHQSYRVAEAPLGMAIRQCFAFLRGNDSFWGNFRCFKQFPEPISGCRWENPSVSDSSSTAGLTKTAVISGSQTSFIMSRTPASFRTNVAVGKKDFQACRSFLKQPGRYTVYRDEWLRAQTYRPG